MKVSQTTYDSDHNAIEKRLSNVEQSASDFKVEITKSVSDQIAEVSGDVDGLAEEIAGFKDTVTGYMDFNGDSLAIGVVGSSFKTEITNTEMAFTENVEKVAYVSNKWTYWGWLKDVAKTDSLPPTSDEPTEGDEEPMAEFATVIADSGSTVNMRTKAKSTAALVERVPIGARVEVLGTCGFWTKVKFGSRAGYMMSQFLTAEKPLEPDENLTLEERVTRLEKRVAMLEAYDGAVG